MKRKIFILVMFLFLQINVLAEGEATLKSIKVNGTECHCSGYNCSVEVDATVATVTYELTDSNATVDRNSGFTIDLTSQVTNIKINVSNELEGEKRENTYNVDIVKHEKSSDYTLKALKVNDDDIKLLDDVFVYAYEAKYYDEKLVIKATSNDKNAKVKVESEYEFPLDRSSLAVDFTVQAEDGTDKTYRIVASRGVRPDTSLKSLKLDHGKINFQKDVLKYEFSVEYSVNDLIIEAVASDDAATVKIEKDDLVVGENEIKIIVTNDKANSEYLLLVTREPNLDKSLANLSQISVTEYPKLNFEENVLDYTLKMSEIPKKLTITAKSKSSDGKVEIVGNEDLKNGSVIKIKNTLIETGITREYTLTLEKQEGIFTSSKKGIIISLIGLIITIIVMFILEIKERKITRHKKLTYILELKKRKEKRSLREKTPKKEEKKEKDKKIDDDLEII